MLLVARRVTLFAFGLLLMGTGALWAQQTVNAPVELVRYPDLIIHNAKIVTMDDTSLMGTTGKTFQAMAVRGDTIEFLGTDSQILRLAGPRTQKFDLKGRTVVPGLINTHNHLHGGYISAWLKKFPDEEAKMRAMAKRRSFNVTGMNFEELTKGIELVLKERMANVPEDEDRKSVV